MSIEGTRLVIGSAKRDGIGGREVPPPVCIRIYPVVPGTPYVSNGGQAATSNPECVGQIVAYQDPANPNYVQLYIAPDLLSWRKVNLASFLVDLRTGKPYDPNAQFYNPLAS